MNKIIHNSSITGAGPLAAQGHSEFEELCALATSGELADEEWARLCEHLRNCDTCRATLEEHEYLAKEIMPAIGAARDPDPDAHKPAISFDVERGERRLMKELASKETTRKKKHKWTGTTLLFVAALVAIATSIGVSVSVFHHKVDRGQTAVTSFVSDATSPVPSAVELNVATERSLELYRSKITVLDQRLRQEAGLRSQYYDEAGNLTQQLQTERDARKKLQSEQEQLNQQLIAAQADANSLRDREASSVATVGQVASLQQELGTLRAELDDRNRRLAENAELLSHDRDIRDLIGARDLLIAEIYDVARTGVRNKPFGRIFYTKDKSLIFYGYDLDKQPGLKRLVAFQAWGGSSNGQNVSLGLLYQDDSKKRWVLKFDDAKTLARLNSVFVTVEPQGGSTTPTGKPMLIASLKIEPNHP